MKARLLVEMYQNGCAVHQELPEAEFTDFSELDDAIKTKWHRVKSVTTGPKDPRTVLFGLMERCCDTWRVNREVLSIRVLQVLLLDPLPQVQYDPSRARVFDS